MKTAAICAATFLAVVTMSYGQQDSTWRRWNWLIGEWVGEGSGTPGQGSGWFSLQPDLGGKILVRRNHSEYPATMNSPKILHDDLMIVSLDKDGRPGNAIYFDNEGHTISYAITGLEKSIVFTSERVPEMPIFRLT